MKSNLLLDGCRHDPHFPTNLLPKLPALFSESPEEAFASFRQIESALSSDKLWISLRDFYIRYASLSQNRALCQEAKSKAWLLATKLAPNALDASQLAMGLLSQENAATSQQEAEAHGVWLAWFLGQCARHQWGSMARRLLDEGKRSSLPFLRSLSAGISAEKEKEHYAPSLLDLPQADANELAQSLEESASVLSHPHQVQDALLEAALLYTRFHSEVDTVVRCWSQLFKTHSQPAKIWRLFYDTTLSAKRWDILSAVLSLRPLKDIPLPNNPLQLHVFLKAIEEKKLPQVEPLPFFVLFFQQAPYEPNRFGRLCKLLQKEQHWEAFDQACRLHQITCQETSLIKESLWRRVIAYQSIPGKKDAISACLQALAFDPNDRRFLDRLLDWSAGMPANHSLYLILESLTREGCGHLEFQLQVTQKLVRFPAKRLAVIELYTLILERIQEQYASFDKAIPHLLEIARNAVELLREHTIALRVLEVLFAKQPEHPEIIPLIEKLRILDGVEDVLLDFLSREQNRAQGMQRATLRLQIARLFFALGRIQEGIQSLISLCDEVRSSLFLLQKIEEIAVEQEAWSLVLKSLQYRIEILQSTDLSGLLLPLYLQAGDLLFHQLKDPKKALLSYRRALLYQPHNPSIWERLQHILLETGAHAELRDLLQEEISIFSKQLEGGESSTAQKAELQKTLASLYARIALLEFKELKHPSRALEALQKAFELDAFQPGLDELRLEIVSHRYRNAPPLLRLNEYLKALGSPDDSSTLSSQQGQSLVEISEIFAEHLRSPRMANAVLQYGLKLAPDDLALLRRASYMSAPEQRKSYLMQLFLASPNTLQPLQQLSNLLEPHERTQLIVVESILRLSGSSFSLEFLEKLEAPRAIRAMTPNHRRTLFCYMPQHQVAHQLFSGFWQFRDKWLPRLTPPPFSKEGLTPVSEKLDKSFQSILRFLGCPESQLMQTSSSHQKIQLFHDSRPIFVLGNDFSTKFTHQEQLFHLGKAAAMLYPPFYAAFLLGGLTSTLMSFLPTEKFPPPTISLLVWELAHKFCSPQELQRLPSIEVWNDMLEFTTTLAGLLCSSSFEPALSHMTKAAQERLQMPQAPITTLVRQDLPFREFLRFALSEEHAALRNELGHQLSVG